MRSERFLDLPRFDTDLDRRLSTIEETRYGILTKTSNEKRFGLR